FHANLIFVGADFTDDVLSPGQAYFNSRMNPYFFLCKGQKDFRRAAEHHAVSRFDGLALLASRGGQIITAHDDVLTGTDDRLAVGWTENVIRRHHEHGRLDLRFDGQRQVNGHLVAVEVRVESFANQGMDSDRISFDQDGLEGLNTHAVQGRSAIEEDRM